MATEIQKEYQLSTEILGHTGDVRAVTSFNVPEEPADYIVTASRDRSACLWVREAGETEFIQRKIMKHAGYVTSICIISRDIAAGREKRKFDDDEYQITISFIALIVTGSQDNEILVHSMEPGVLGNIGMMVVKILMHHVLQSQCRDTMDTLEPSHV